MGRRESLGFLIVNFQLTEMIKETKMTRFPVVPLKGTIVVSRLLADDALFFELLGVSNLSIQKSPLLAEFRHQLQPFRPESGTSIRR
jgi:hypothetical protein